ncbi:hypothetical protein E2C01_074880 [Portunus trituberculatus]|uniref:Uncharacterized protein n=1 Tax=Portunus trituberculatus TaxID=210409 RepID=A0A5B7IDF0_PORTR|nr:hypothetical protein [Portunus trituberculatus]
MHGASRSQCLGVAPSHDLQLNLAHFYTLNSTTRSVLITVIRFGRCAATVTATVIVAVADVVPYGAAASAAAGECGWWG